MATHPHKFSVIYSFFNNYVLLENEVIPRMKKYRRNVNLVIVDDNSSEEQYRFGKEICLRNGLIFIRNHGDGVAHAVDTAINYLCEESSTSPRWIFCSQQDIYPRDDSFFTNFSEQLDGLEGNSLPGAIGFNVLDNYYSHGSVQNGLLGSFFLSRKPSSYDRLRFLFSIRTIKHIVRHPLDLQNSWIRFMGHSRLFSPKTLRNFQQVRALYTSAFSIELPMWAFIAINVQSWKRHIDPSTGLIFHLWFNDIAMQFLSKSQQIIVIPDLYVENNQDLKAKHGFNVNSADAGRAEQIEQVEKYGRHLAIFQERWGFDYEAPWRSARYINVRYAETLVGKHFNHNPNRGPLESTEL